MLGAIVGDIIGSVYERYSVKGKDFEFFPEGYRFTDDTVMTLAVAKWLMEDASHSSSHLIECMQELGRKYPRAGYGFSFFHWLMSNNPQPYNSWGNGSAMRVSPIGLYAKDMDEVMNLADISASVTHNHPEGIKGAQAIASCVFLAKQGYDKTKIKDFVTDTFHYDLERKIDEIRPHYQFEVSCQKSVPESIIAFIEGKDFDDVIRNAISLGGDSDTMADMAGAIQSAYHYHDHHLSSSIISKEIVLNCEKALTPELFKLQTDFELFIQNDNEPHHFYNQPIKP